MQVTLLNSASDVSKAIESIGRRSKSVRNDLHQVLCSLAKSTHEHGDIRPLIRLFEVLQDTGIKLNAVKTWSERYCAITAYEDSEGKLSWKHDKASKPNLGKAMDEPFWKIKSLEDDNYQPIDAMKSLDQLINRLNKDQEKALKAGKEVSHAELVGKLEAAKAALQDA